MADTKPIGVEAVRSNLRSTKLGLDSATDHLTTAPDLAAREIHSCIELLEATFDLLAAIIEHAQ